MRVVITGASGNVGTALLRRLAAEPAVTSLTGLCRRLPDTDQSPYEAVDWVAVDIAEPASSGVLRDCFAGADAVVHLAWQIQPSHRPVQLQKTNVEGSGRVFRAARDAGVRHLVHASSVGTYAADAAAARPNGPGEPVRRGEAWPATGVPTSSYSRHKAAAEVLLDEAAAGSDMVVSRLRPALIFQGEAGAQITRYFLGALAPAWALRRVPLPLVPLPRGLRMQAVHADDIADAYARVILRRAAGAFNIAAEPVLDLPALARALRGRPVALPPAAFRRLAGLTWRGRLQPTEPGWLDLAMAAPLLSTERARSVLGWQPATSATDALRELLDGMAAGRGTASPAMRDRDPVLVRLVGLLRGRLTGSARRT